MKVIKRTATYFGVPVEITEKRQGGPNGVREIVTHWLGDADPRNGSWRKGDEVSKTVKGNFLAGTLKVLTPEHLINDNPLLDIFATLDPIATAEVVGTRVTFYEFDGTVYATTDDWEIVFSTGVDAYDKVGLSGLLEQVKEQLLA